MKYASVCDGIGAVHVAWQPLGWKCLWTSEIDAFPAAVVAQRWGFQNYGDALMHAGATNAFDFMRWEDSDGETPDLIVSGTPCQSFSVAGLRQGLRDPRGGLMLTFVEIAHRYRPRWLVWENVPGVLSSGRGRDFGSLLGALGHLGYGWAYRVLDAQWFGLAQRRKRCFLVGSLGDQRSAAAVLFERESVRRDNPPKREKGSGSASRAAGCAGGGSAVKTLTIWQPCRDCGNDWCNVHEKHAADCPCPDLEKWARDPAETPLDFAAASTAIFTGDGIVADRVSANERHTYTHEGNTFRLHNCVGVPFAKSRRAQSATDDETWIAGDVAPTVNCFDQGDTRTTVAVAHEMRVRRLTPRECERLQGFPDDYTAIEFRGKPAVDGPRYKAIGNSMAVPVMRWLGERIAAVERSVGQS
jgi:DNA (cytosine-5)-methyltransferase 1